MHELLIAFLVVILILVIFSGSGSSSDDQSMEHPDIILVLAPLRAEASRANAEAANAANAANSEASNLGDSGSEHLQSRMEHANNNANAAVANAQVANARLAAAENAATQTLGNGGSPKDAANNAVKAANSVLAHPPTTVGDDAYSGTRSCENVLNGSKPYHSYDNCMSNCGRCQAYSTEPILREMTFYNNLYDKEHSSEKDPNVQAEFQRIYAAF